MDWVLQTAGKPPTHGAAICPTQKHLVSRTRQIIWTTTPPSCKKLKLDGFHVVQYANIKRQVEKSRTAGTSRSSLKNPADGILSLFRKHPKIAVVGSLSNHLEDLQILYGFIVEPAFHCGCTLLVGADQTLIEIEALAESSAFHDKQWRFPWTIERLLDIAKRGRGSQRVSVPVYANPWQQFWNRVRPASGTIIPPSPGTRLDQEQMRAVKAGDGVVQIIAPAGSGKTTVLIERVKELQKRGTQPERILCMSFNRDAKVEIGDRLIRAGVEGVVVRSFHGMGLAILKDEGHLRKEIGGLGDAILEQLITQATEMETPRDDHGKQDNSLTVADARNAISEFKLAAMITPEEALQKAANTTTEKQMAARLFELHERELAKQNALDFDDLVAQTVSLLQTNSELRSRWQGKFDRVLVDEYQDIEPSQALLVGILAAPQDSIFCVGDEDQCIYAWRRATVQRIIELDQVYPGLERHALIRNYRCGRRITEASRRLVQHNKIRFRKPLQAGAREKGAIVAVSCKSRLAGANLTAHLISDAVRDEVVVLARTSRLLEEIKTACQNLFGGDPTIELATIHGSKGREWNRVILYAVDEGQTPHAQAVAEGAIEDERRLFYVALTRAKERLEIICTEKKESRFLKEGGIVPQPLLHPNSALLRTNN